MVPFFAILPYCQKKLDLTGTIIRWKRGLSSYQQGVHVKMSIIIDDACI
jgi:hypothetical protein